jgi:L-alanine-DL-glutamate epimerase-like enolase superfamily enzyme
LCKRFLTCNNRADAAPSEDVGRGSPSSSTSFGFGVARRDFLMTTVERVTAQAVRVPVSKTTRQSTRTLDKRDFVIVRIEGSGTDKIGEGYTYAGTSGGRLLAAAIEDMLAPVLIGQDAEDVLTHWERLYQEILLQGRRGFLVRALSGVDIALWDLAAKRAGLPLAVLLGGARKAVPAYASGGYYRPDEGPWVDAVRAEIQLNRSLGFRDHKIKVGGLSIEEDAQRVAAAVEETGAAGRLAVDANNAYSTVGDALRAVRAFERAAGTQGLWWVEELLSPENVEGHRHIARVIETPVATGEIHQTRWDFRQLIEREAADILQPDAGVMGGVSEFLRAARAAETFGLPIAPHWHANLHVHLAAASPNCLAIEHFALQKDIYNFETLLTPESRLVVVDGMAAIPDRPGLGIEFDETRLKQYAVEN